MRLYKYLEVMEILFTIEKIYQIDLKEIASNLSDWNKKNFYKELKKLIILDDFEFIASWIKARKYSLIEQKANDVYNRNKNIFLNLQELRKQKEINVEILAKFLPLDNEVVNKITKGDKSNLEEDDDYDEYIKNEMLYMFNCFSPHLKQLKEPKKYKNSFVWTIDEEEIEYEEEQENNERKKRAWYDVPDARYCTVCQMRPCHCSDPF